jgi:hypothetical protein
MLLREKQVSDLIVGDIIFSALVIGTDVRYKTCRVISFEDSKENTLQVLVKQKALEASPDELGEESEMILFKNQTILTISNSNVAFIGWLMLGILFTAIIFGLTYPYFLNCQ